MCLICCQMLLWGYLWIWAVYEQHQQRYARWWWPIIHTMWDFFLFYKRYTVLKKHNCCCWNEVEPFNIGVVDMFSYTSAFNLLQYCNSLQFPSPVSFCEIFSFVACMHAKVIFFIHLCCPKILEKNCLQVCEGNVGSEPISLFWWQSHCSVALWIENICIDL